MAFVMIVDDNEAQCCLMAKLMALLGHSPATFQDPTEGLEYLQEAGNLVPDLIILDYMMPVMDGLEFLRRLRAGDSASDVPVAMFTADDDPYLMQRAYAAGASAFWVKSKKDFAAINEDVERLLHSATAFDRRRAVSRELMASA